MLCRISRNDFSKLCKLCLMISWLLFLSKLIYIVANAQPTKRSITARHLYNSWGKTVRLISYKIIKFKLTWRVFQSAFYSTRMRSCLVVIVARFSSLVKINILSLQYWVIKVSIFNFVSIAVKSFEVNLSSCSSL